MAERRWGRGSSRTAGSGHGGGATRSGVVAYDQYGYDQYGYDQYGFDQYGLDQYGLDQYGYDRDGFDQHGYDRDGSDQYGYDQHGFDAAGYDRHGFDAAGFDRDGLDREGFDHDGVHAPGGGRARGPGQVMPPLGAPDGRHPDEPYAEGPYAEGPYAEGPYAEGPYAEGGYADGGYADDRYAGGGYVDGQYVDGQDAGHSYDDGYDDQGGGAGPSGARAVPGRRRRRHPVLIALLAIGVIVAVILGGGILWSLHQLNPGGKLGRRVTVRIRAGESTQAIGDALVQAGVIHGNGSLFRYYVKLQGAGPLLPGRYRLAKNESYQRVVGLLQVAPPVVDDTLVIPEGFDLREIAARVAALPGMHLSAAAFLAAAKDGSVRSPFEPAAVNDLEGLLFPATYKINQSATVPEVLTEMVSAFDQRANALDLTTAATKLHLTPYDLIKVASIIQGEAKLDGDRPDVASVLYNRLGNGSPLGADSTLIYALRQSDPTVNIKSVNYRQANPYNTRLKAGLPPTPINNPGLPSLQAAADPPATGYQYFVEVNTDGKLGFASDSAGFAQLTAECQAAKLC